MKKVRWNYLLVIFVAMAMLSIQSCSKDDDATGPTDTPIVGTDPGDEDGEDIKNITRYKVDGENIIKDQDLKLPDKHWHFKEILKNIRKSGS